MNIIKRAIWLLKYDKRDVMTIHIGTDYIMVESRKDGFPAEASWRIDSPYLQVRLPDKLVEQVQNYKGWVSNPL